MPSAKGKFKYIKSSGVRNYFKKTNATLHISFYAALNEQVEILLKETITRAKRNSRNVIHARDMSTII